MNRNLLGYQILHTHFVLHISLFPPEDQALLNCSAVQADGTPIFETDQPTCVNLTTLTPNPSCHNNTPSSGGGVICMYSFSLHCSASRNYLYNWQPNCTDNPNNTNPNGGCQVYNSSLTPNTSIYCAPFISELVWIYVGIILSSFTTFH